MKKRNRTSAKKKLAWLKAHDTGKESAVALAVRMKHLYAPTTRVSEIARSVERMRGRTC